ncbi:winged helix-turn-helix transcriptional regulator [Candidatus Micrarchaeota archaeon]|nr:winged helix-turn-helix transcriptional regulator [Candidatus Micrarchaeota archaeon]
MESPDLIVTKEMLKAISTESRLELLRSLKERQKTQTELATELKLSPPTVLEHIQQLEKAGLVELVKEDKERKWKYYQLTKPGRKLIEKKPLNILLLLTASSLAIFGGLILFRPAQEVPLEAKTLAAESAPVMSSASFSTFDIAIIIFGLITLALLCAHLFKLLKKKN